MISKARNNSANQKQDSQKIVSEAISSHKGIKVSNEEVIRQIAQDKRSSIKSSKQPPKAQKPQIPTKTETKPILEQQKVQQMESSLKQTQQFIPNATNDEKEQESMNLKLLQQERIFQAKIKEKTRELNQLKAQVQFQEESIEDLNQVLKTQKDLLDQKTNSDQINYHEKRNLLMSQTIINQRRLINQYTKAMQQTKMIQVELDYQLDKVSTYLQSQALDKQIDGFLDQILKMKQKLKYITSQEHYNKADGYFKKTENKNNKLQLTIKAENCIALILQHLQQNNEIQFNQTKLFDALSTFSILMLKEQDNIPIQFQQTHIMLESHLVRIQGKFTSIFPYYNSNKELVMKNIQNDKVFQQLGSQDLKLEELTNLKNTKSQSTNSTFFLYKSISVLKSMLIHTLTCIHTYNLEPQLKSLTTKILPFIENCLVLFNQYYSDNPAMGAQAIWGLFQANAESLETQIQQTKQDLNTFKTQHKGLWSDLFNKDYFDTVEGQNK